MGRRKAHASGGHSSSERWLLTYADLITLLLIYFIVLFAMSQIDVTKYHKMADAMSNAFNVIPSQGGTADSVLPPGSMMVMPPVAPMYEEQETFKEIREEVEKLEKEPKAASGSFDVHEEKRGLVISIADTALFNAGSADVNPNMQRTLDKIAMSLRDINNRVHIEGHTDDIPMRGGRFASNWELSVARSTNVLRYLAERRGLPAGRLAAAGYGEHYPRVPNLSPEARAKNRRVDIVILRDASAAKTEPAARERAKIIDLTKQGPGGHGQNPGSHEGGTGQTDHGH